MKRIIKQVNINGHQYALVEESGQFRIYSLEFGIFTIVAYDSEKSALKALNRKVA